MKIQKSILERFLMTNFLFKLPLTREIIRSARYDKENIEVRTLWRDFEIGVHKRVPIKLNSNPKVLILTPELNTPNIQFREYFYNPDLMAEVQLNWEVRRRFLLPGDHEHGLPERWEIYIDFQNVYDASWFGAPLVFLDNQVPFTSPILNNDNKYMLLDKGIPAPFAGELAHLAIRYLDHFK